jgi:hypothetical protein
MKTQSFLQEKELAKAAGKLADCQKTIASLSSQLKSLADLDEFLPGTETSGAACSIQRVIPRRLAIWQSHDPRGKWIFLFGFCRMMA